MKKVKKLKQVAKSDYGPLGVTVVKHVASITGKYEKAQNGI